jgi:hypothetical protein
MTAAERQRLRRERLRAAEPAKVAKPASKPAKATAAPASDELIEARKEIEWLREEVERLRQENAALKAAVANAQRPEPRPQPKQTPQQAHAAARYQQWRHARVRFNEERAQYGGRSKSLVIDDIGRLLRSKGVLDDHVRETIINAMLPHVRDQADIEKGISRRTYRKVWADLHPQRNPAGVTAFVAFKALDMTKGGRPNRNTIVIAADRVTTMSDHWRKRQERSDRAKATATKRKAKT